MSKYLAKRSLIAVFTSATVLFLYHETSRSSEEVGDRGSLTHQQIETMVDDGRVLTCEGLKLHRCTDPDLEEAARSDFRSRQGDVSNTYLLANSQSGNVWGLRLSKGALDGGVAGGGVSAESLTVPSSMARQWVDYLQITHRKR